MASLTMKIKNVPDTFNITLVQEGVNFLNIMVKTLYFRLDNYKMDSFIMNINGISNTIGCRKECASLIKVAGKKNLSNKGLRTYSD